MATAFWIWGRQNMHELITLINYLNDQNQRKTETFDLFVAPCKGMRILESGKILLVESGILGFGIWNTAQGIWNPTWSRIQVPLLDSFTWGDFCSNLNENNFMQDEWF